MKDFLRYMQSLDAWQDWQPSHSAQLYSQLTKSRVSRVPVTRSPQAIFDYAQHHELLNHAWLKAFQQADINPILLRIWLHQRYLLSWCFPNWLTAVLAKLPTSQARIPLLHNLYEEHGLIPGSQHYSKPHPQMWRSLFEELGAIAPGEPLPLPDSVGKLLGGTQIYLQLYTQACFRCPTMVGLGAMTFTESILPHENLSILAGLSKLGISERGQEFFAVHAACDEDHATEIIQVIEQVADCPDSLHDVWLGVAMAVTARQAFYDSLWHLSEVGQKRAAATLLAAV